MFGARIEDRFLNDATAEGKRGTRGAGALILVIFVGLAAFFFWAWAYEIEEVTRGTGRVIPSQQLQVMQSLEGGIVTEIVVREGDEVRQGQELLRIDDTSAGSDLGELREREEVLLATATRIDAEAQGQNNLTFSTELRENAPEAVAAETQVFLSRQRQLASEIAVLQDQLAQRRAALIETRALLTKLEAELAPLTEETELTRDLAARGTVPRIELLRLESDLAAVQGELEVVRAREPGIEAAVREAENQIQSARSSFVLNARERGAEVSGELMVLREAMRAATAKVSRTSLRAPVNGIVNRLNVTTLGAVVRPGEPLVEIVPLDDTLLVEAQVRPRDVAFIRPGDPASVKITAYDYLVYGALDGTVERIGADALGDQNGNQFFRVMIRTAENGLSAADGSALPISPGMVAQVDILTGRKTVLDYLLRPLRRVQAEAIREK